MLLILIFTAGLQRGDNVSSTWRQRGTLPKYAFFLQNGNQKRSTKRPKRNTVTGALGSFEHVVIITKPRQHKFTIREICTNSGMSGFLLRQYQIAADLKPLMTWMLYSDIR